MRFAIVLTVLLACGSAPAQNRATPGSDVPKLEGLNAAQQRAVEEYVRQNERPTGELRWIADRRIINVLIPGASDALPKVSICGCQVDHRR